MISLKSFSRASLVVASFALGGCSQFGPFEAKEIASPTLTPVTPIGARLAFLSSPAQKVDVAIYSYEDRTGQQKPAEGYANFSKAVTQGGDAILVDVLKDVGNGQWFNVIERNGLKNLMTERGLIDQTNENYKNLQRSSLPPLRFAGMLIEGGIIDYDSNVLTGGDGASILGIGYNTQYRRDRVSVALRAVSVSTGEVLVSVQTDKTVYSVLEQDSAFLYVSSDAIFQFERGYTRNEPVGLAVRQAIELAVYGLVMEGANANLWAFADEIEGRRLVDDYRSLKAGQPDWVDALYSETTPENSQFTGVE